MKSKKQSQVLKNLEKKLDDLTLKTLWDEGEENGIEYTKSHPGPMPGGCCGGGCGTEVTEIPIGLQNYLDSHPQMIEILKASGDIVEIEE